MKKYFLILTTLSLVAIVGCTKKTIACFSVSSSTISANAVVEFNASCSQSASLYTWNFGDGTADTTSSFETISHTFSSPGNYIVTLNVIRKDGHTLGKDKPTKTQTVTVQ